MMHDYDQLHSHPKVVELAKKAEELGLQFKIEGWPFGAEYSTHNETLSDIDVDPMTGLSTNDALHASDCATHNAPASTVGPCDCR